MNYRKILKHLRILQTISNEERQKKGLEKLGRGFFEAHRFNPFNPLSYVTIILTLVFGILMFGFIGFFDQTTTLNPFKWD
jgi:hypothetical protein